VSFLAAGSLLRRARWSFQCGTQLQCRWGTLEQPRLFPDATAWRRRSDSNGHPSVARRAKFPPSLDRLHRPAPSLSPRAGVWAANLTLLAARPGCCGLVSAAVVASRSLPLPAPCRQRGRVRCCAAAFLAVHPAMAWRRTTLASSAASSAACPTAHPAVRCACAE
jgi:hypothetical protein